jgi:quinol monooxygenase YgiN
MNKISIVANFEAVEGKFEQLLKLIKEHAQRCVDNEPGCLYFDITVPREERNHILLYEVYAGQAALDAHLSTDHMREFRKSRKGLFVKVEAVNCDVVQGLRK